MSGPESPGPREEETPPEVEAPTREEIEGRIDGLNDALARELDKMEADVLALQEAGINDDDVLETIDEDTEEEEDALTEALIENGMSPEEAEAWEIIKGFKFDELFGETEGLFSQMVMEEMGIDEEQWFKIFEASPGLQGYSEAMSRGFVPTEETYPRSEYLWKNASHFTVPNSYGTRVTSNPQANRGTVRNKEGRVVSRGGHKGVDLAFPIGTPLIATVNSRIIDVSLNRTTGMKVVIQYPDGSVASFGHLDAVHVQKGDVIKPGSVFAKTGNTGYSTGPHLHLQTYRNNKLADPFSFLGGTGLEPRGGAENYNFDDHFGHNHD